MSKINKNLYILTLSFLFIIIFFSLKINNVFAATISFSPSSGSYNVGDTIKAKIIINSDVSVNAVSSKVLFTTDLLNLSSISKSGSIVSLWAQEPSFSNSNGIASLEGVILNGYTGSGGNIVTLIFNAKKEGTAEIKFSNTSILANDGNGTEVITGNSSSFITIAKAIDKPKESPTVTKTPIENVVEKAKEAVVTVREVEQANNLPDYSLVITLMLVIILLLVLIVIYGIYYLNKIKKYLKKKLIKTEKDVSNKFDILEKDIYKEAIISEKLKKNENLNESEITALVDFKQDIKNTEKDILEDIKDIENDN